MQVTLPRFASAEVDVDPDTIINIPGGIPGFEHCTRYKLLHDAATDMPRVFWLQSLDDPNVAFALTDPDYLNISYDMSISDDEQRALDFADGDDVQIAVMLAQQFGNDDVICAYPDAPIAINLNKRRAIQKPLSSNNYSIHA